MKKSSVAVLVLSGLTGAGSIAAEDGGRPRPDPATTVFLDHGPDVRNNSSTYDPDTRTCGRGKYRVYNDVHQAVVALKQAKVLYVRAGTYSRVVTPNVRVHGNGVNYWEGALPIHATGTPEQHKVVRAYRDEEVIIQAKPGVSQYNPDPNDRTFRRSSHFFPNPAISIHGAYMDVSGFKTFGQVVIAAHDVALENCDLGGGGPHMNQGQVVVLNSNRPGGVFNVVIRNNRIHHSTWGESVGNGSTLMCYNNTFINCGGGGQNGDVSDWQNPEIQLRNNLYYHARPKQTFYDIQTDPWGRLESDWNLFYSTTADTTWRHKYRSRASTLADWQKYSGKDAHSVWKDPGFVRPGGNRPEDFKRKDAIDFGIAAGSEYSRACGAYATGKEIVGIEMKQDR